MKSNVSKFFAVVLSVLMAFSVSLTAYAQSPSITLTTSDKCYAGITYDFVATVTNLSKDSVIGDSETTTAFTWNVDNNLSINTTNDYKIVENSDGLYTVSETAKVTLPSTVGTVVAVTASYGSLSKKSIEVTTLQPIVSISVDADDNTTGTYYYKTSNDASNDVLYLNSYVSGTDKGIAELKYSVQPTGTTDKVAAIRDNQYTDVDNQTDDNTLTVNFNSKNAPINSTLTLSPESGYAFTKKISVVSCIALTQYSLSNNSLSVADAGGDVGSTSAIAGDSFTLTPTNKKPTNANDTFDYKLYTSSDCDKLAPDNYYSANSDGSCSFNISNPGTYFLVCSAVSYGGGYLTRDLVATLYITINEAQPISSLELYKTDDNDALTSEKLNSVVLYTQTAKTYDISKNLSILPVGYTNDVGYLIDDTTIATVDANGIITAKKSGTTTIHIYSDKNSNVQTSATIVVKQEITAINSIVGEDMTDLVLPTGHAVQLVANTTPAVSDETLRWSSQNTDALTVTSTGYAIANTNYDFGDAEYQYVMVTATSERGIIGYSYVKVVPAIESAYVDVSIGSTATKVENKTNTYKAFAKNSFTLNGVGYDKDNNVSNDIYVWMVSCDGATQTYFDDASSYFTYKYDSVTDTYTITPTSACSLQFYCYAIKRGQPVDNNTIYGSAYVNVYSKATSLSFVNPDDTSKSYTSAYLPAGSGESVKVAVKMAPISSYDDDPVSFSSSNEDVATVVQNSSNTATITVGNVQGTATITAVTESGAKSATFKVISNNNINFVTIYNNYTGEKQILEPNTDFEYTGQAVAITPYVEYNELKLDTTYYSISYVGTTATGTAYSSTKAPTNVGTYTLVITGADEFKGSVKKINFTISPKNLSACTVTVTDGYFETITTSNPQPTINLNKLSVKDEERAVKLANNTDFELVCSNNTKSGTATVTITGKGNYTGTVKANYNVCDQASKLVISSISSKTYSGLAQTPTVTVKYNGKTVSTDKYTVKYSNNVNVGTATVTITGVTPYFTGVTTATFKINPPATTALKATSRTSSSITLSWAKNDYASGYQIYDVLAKKIVATISDVNTLTYQVTGLKSAKEYRYKIRAFKVISGETYYGKYSSIYYTYTKPKTPTLTLKTSSKSITASWSKVSGVSGYQIQYSTKSSFSGASVTSLSSSKISKKYTKLKKGKTYYVRLRTYKTLKINGKTKTVYSSWKTKKIVCK
jgi:hypothetical protein